MKQSFEIVFISPSSTSEKSDLYSDLKKLQGVVPKKENNTTSIVFNDDKLKGQLLHD